MKVKFIVRSLRSGKKLSLLKDTPKQAIKSAQRLGFSTDKVLIEEVLVG